MASIMERLDALEGTAGEPAPAPSTPNYADMGVVEVLGEAWKNLGSSAKQFGSDTIRPFTHPIQTASSLYDLSKGVVQLAIPGEQGSEEMARAVGQFFVDRYGSWDNIKRTIATDPVGFLADASVPVTVGSTLVAKVPQTASVLTRGASTTGKVGKALNIAGKIGRAGQNVGRAMDPATAVASAAQQGVRVVGPVAAHAVGALGTQTGGRSINELASAGYQGGKVMDAGLDSMRSSEMAARGVVDRSRAALSKIRQDRSAQYVRDIAPITSDPTVLDLSQVQKAIADVQGVGTFKEFVKDASAQQVWAQINDKVSEISKRGVVDPDYLTVAGIDALKQSIGDIRDNLPYGTPARRVADEAYHAVRNQIIEQAPDYAKVMKNYEDASELIRELEGTLSLNPNARVDTTLRKLQSVMRNNVNTNYGQRLSLVENLNRYDPTIMPSLAGQAHNSFRPRGFGNITAPSIAAAAYLTGNPAGYALLPFQSPRLVGEGAMLTGRLARRLGEAGPPALAQGAFQAGRVPQMDERSLAYRLATSPPPRPRR